MVTAFITDRFHFPYHMKGEMEYYEQVPMFLHFKLLLSDNSTHCTHLLPKDLEALVQRD